MTVGSVTLKVFCAEYDTRLVRDRVTSQAITNGISTVTRCHYAVERYCVIRLLDRPESCTMPTSDAGCRSGGVTSTVTQQCSERRPAVIVREEALPVNVQSASP